MRFRENQGGLPAPVIGPVLVTNMVFVVGERLQQMVVRVEDLWGGLWVGADHVLCLLWPPQGLWRQSWWRSLNLVANTGSEGCCEAEEDSIGPCWPMDLSAQLTSACSLRPTSPTFWNHSVRLTLTLGQHDIRKSSSYRCCGFIFSLSPLRD